MYTWFKIFNKTEFIALGLISRTYSLNLEGIGVKDILATMGNQVGVTYEGVFLALTDGGANPFAFDGYALYVDANNDVHLGIEIE